jgi:two-component system CheB/CheR fusion protein
MQIETVGIVFFAASGTVVDCNDAFLRMSGVTRRSVERGDVLMDALTARERPGRGHTALDEFRRRGRIAPYERDCIRPDGSRWTGLFAATRIGDGEGVAYVVDVSERRRAEAAQRASEAEFRAMFELSSVGQCQADLATGTIVRANVRFCKIAGRSRQQLARTTLEALTHPGDRAAVGAMLQRLLSGADAESTLQARLVHPDGAAVWVEGNVTLMRDDAGNPVKMAAIVRDVTLQRQTENALAESRERLRLVVDSARDYAIVSMDLARRVTSWNSGAELITGYSAAEMIGRSADIVFTPEDVQRGDAEREAEIALATGRAANERWHQRRDGTRFWGSGVLMSMMDDAKRPIGLVKIFRDETETRRWNESLAASRNQLWDALRENETARRELAAALRAKDQFLAMLSHELRTPLTPVLIAARALALREDLPAEARTALAAIERNVRIEASFIEDLLEVTRITQGRLEILRAPTDLHDVVRAAVHACGPGVDEKNVHCELELCAERHTVEGDARRLEQAVRHVVANAVKFTPPGGGVLIRTDTVGELVRLTVRDDGIGIEADRLPDIFEAFTQAGEWVAREYGGVGVGLAIAKASIEAHGGSIAASSAGKHRGTTLTIELPLMA